jgi:hypothetical protein
MMTVPLDVGFCPERWKQPVGVMLEKLPGISRSNKQRIIQFLEADINQVLRIAFASNITRLVRDHIRTSIRKGAQNMYDSRNQQTAYNSTYNTKESGRRSI